jgi:putative ABC transport system substrate-binding protein
MEIGIGRRQFISALSGAGLAWPLAARAQRMRRIGVLAGYAESDPQWKLNVAAFLHRLHEFGRSDGQNLRIDYRFGFGDPSRIRNAATELVRLTPEVIICNSTPIVTALLQETKTIPIVFVLVVDPVGSGLVSSLAKPGANVTGFSGFEFEMTNKWLGILKEIAPRLGRVMLTFNPDTASYFEYFLRPAEEAASAVGVEILELPFMMRSKLSMRSRRSRASRMAASLFCQIFSLWFIANISSHWRPNTVCHLYIPTVRFL